MDYCHAKYVKKPPTSCSVIWKMLWKRNKKKRKQTPYSRPSGQWPRPSLGPTKPLASSPCLSPVRPTLSPRSAQLAAQAAQPHAVPPSLFLWLIAGPRSSLADTRDPPGSARLLPPNRNQAGLKQQILNHRYFVGLSQPKPYKAPSSVPMCCFPLLSQKPNPSRHFQPRFRSRRDRALSPLRRALHVLSQAESSA
jgi:hypothetical protein